MTELFDPSGDFDQVVDRAETVTFRRGQSSSGTTVAGALRRRLSEREAAASEGRVTAADVRWHLPTSSLDEPPAPGDHIVDADAANWSVLEVRTETAGSRWLCLARNLAVVHGLFERIDIERATWIKDAAGAAKATWHAHLAGLRARIQARETQLRVDDGRQHALATHTIYLAEPVVVDQDHRVVGPGGRIYRILDSKAAQQLGAPFVLDVVELGNLDCGTTTPASNFAP